MMINEAENHEYSVAEMHTVINGSAAVSKELYDDFRETFPHVRNIISSQLGPLRLSRGLAQASKVQLTFGASAYGMTEIGLITRTVPADKYSASCGILAANLSLKVCAHTQLYRILLFGEQ